MDTEEEFPLDSSRTEFPNRLSQNHNFRSAGNRSQGATHLSNTLRRQVRKDTDHEVGAIRVFRLFRNLRRNGLGLHF